MTIGKAELILITAQLHPGPWHNWDGGSTELCLLFSIIPSPKQCYSTDAVKALQPECWKPGAGFSAVLFHKHNSLLRRATLTLLQQRGDESDHPPPCH